MSKNYFITGATLSDGSKKNMYISDGKIAGYENPAGSKALVIEADGKVILPGLVDLHTHLREPGKEDAETVLSGSMAAAKGGYVAISAMANTSPVADTAGVVTINKSVRGNMRARPICTSPVPGGISMSR